MPPPGAKKKNSSTGSRFDILNEFTEFPTIDAKRKRHDEQFQTNSYFSKKANLDDIQQGPKFITIKRDCSSDQSLRNVSPFLIQKSIESFAGKPKAIKRLRDGSLLIESINKKQADKLYRMTQISDDIKIKVMEHPTLNTTKGTIYCRELIELDDNEILDGLKEQSVIDIVRLKRREGADLKDTGVFILTFKLHAIPMTIHAGFLNLSVKLYIPNPRRCFKCQRFGHGKNHCRNDEICGKCANPSHNKDSCTEPKPKCRNCEEEHPSWSRECATYQQEKEIQKIQTVNRVTNYEARTRYRTLYPLFYRQTYTETLQTKTHKTNTAPNNSPDTYAIANQSTSTNINIHQYTSTNMNKHQSNSTDTNIHLNENQITTLNQHTHKNINTDSENTFNSTNTDSENQLNSTNTTKNIYYIKNSSTDSLNKINLMDT